jgi:superoxide dismutase, Cu-Zn family
MRNKLSLLSRNVLLGCCAAPLVACAAAEPDVVNAEAALERSENGGVSVSAELKAAGGSRIGVATFRSDGDMMFVAIAAELPAGHPSLHGLHIHANDRHDNGDGCIADPMEPASTHFASADGHWNPGGAHHGDHVGDMPALFFTHGGHASMEFLTDRFSTDELLGRAVILHASSDNYGNIPIGSEPNQYTPNSPAATELTQNTGNGGARIACGIIE